MKSQQNEMLENTVVLDCNNLKMLKACKGSLIIFVLCARKNKRF